MHADRLRPGEKDVRYDLGGRTPATAGTRTVCRHHHDTLPDDDRWPPLVRVCVTVGCSVLAWATLLVPAWYLLSY